MVPYFVKIHDHTLRLSDLWAPHNHARPLVFRALLLVNGLVTNWDIRSEYVYLEATVLLAFALQAFALVKICGGWTSRCLVLLSILSILSFSPAGHNNHWWSFMLVLDLAHLLIVSAFLIVCAAPRTWKANLLCALACWLATYTLSNGLVAFVAAATAVQLAKRSSFRLDRFSFFWISNIVAVLALYLPGLAESGGAIKHFEKLVEFCFAYLGAPVVSLFVFPFRNMFDVPPVTLRNALVGVLLLLAVIALGIRLRRHVASSTLSVSLFICFSILALSSAVLTGWGRAEFDAVGVANANASRYTLFSTYLLYAFLYLAADSKLTPLIEPVRLKGKVSVKAGVLAAWILFIGFSARSYAASISVYQEAHRFNQNLAKAFWEGDPEDEKFVYPNRQFVEEILVDMKRLRIGPYAFAHQQNSDLITELAQHKTVDQFGVNGVRSLAEQGQVLFSNPESQYELTLSSKARSIHLEFGILDAALKNTPLPAGVTFSLILKHEPQSRVELWSRTLRPLLEPKDKGLQSADVSIRPSDSDHLVFETKAVADPQGCWAYWQNIRIHD